MFYKVHILLSLFVALIVTVISILGNITFYDTMLRIIITIIVSFTVGMFAKYYLQKKVFIEDSTDEILEKTLDTHSEQEDEQKNSDLDVLS